MVRGQDALTEDNDSRPQKSITTSPALLQGSRDACRDVSREALVPDCQRCDPSKKLLLPLSFIQLSCDLDDVFANF